MSSSVAVIGNGYVGTVVAACFAALGRRVIGVEADRHKIEILSSGRAPFFEAGLDDLMAAGVGNTLSFTDDVRSALEDSEVIFLCVGTPSAQGGGADLSALHTVARAIATLPDRPRIFVTKSTVPVGTGEWLRATILSERNGSGPGAPIAIVSNPEFLRAGSAVSDFLHPDRVVLGSDDPHALDVLTELYRPILEQSFLSGDPTRAPRLIRTSLATAEAIKYASNAFLAMKISFINEIGNICERVGADVTEIAAAVGLDSRIGPQFLEAGLGWGGSCFGKDLSALATLAGGLGYNAELLKAVAAVNRRQRGMVIEKLRRHLGDLSGTRIGILGLAFKPGTDDLRDSPGVDVVKRLLETGAQVTAYDPVVRSVPDVPELSTLLDPYAVADGADALVLATDWPEFRDLDLARLRARMHGNLLIDGRNMFDPASVERAGLVLESFGRARPTVTQSAGAGVTTS
jgi:UDPglucose 6-dehydrogenase